LKSAFNFKLLPFSVLPLPRFFPLHARACAFATTLIASHVASLADSTETESSKDEPARLRADKGEVIVITGTLNETPLRDSVVATEVMTREEIVDSGAQNVAELLDDQPGVEVIQGFRGQEIRILGLASKHVLILVNGERAIGRINGGLDLERLSALDIERIEIVKGAGSALYGSDAIGGVVNIITRMAQRPFEAEVTSTAGSLGTRIAGSNVGMRQGPLSARATGGWQKRDPYDLDPNDASTTSSSFEEFDAGLALGYRLSEASEITASGDYSLRNARGVDEQGRATFDRVTRTETSGASLGAETRIGKHRLSARLRYQRFRDQFLYDQHNSEDLDQKQETTQDFVRGQAKYDVVVGQHLLTFGADAMAESMSAQRISENGQRLRLGAFAQDEWLVSSAPQISIAPGIRFDHDSQFGGNLNPKVAARYVPTDSLTVRASYGFGYRAPDFKELYHQFQNGPAGYEIVGNPNLRPETSRSVTVGAEFTPHPMLWTSASVFHTEIDNLILIDTRSELAGMTLFEYDNFAQARTMGGETQLRLQPHSTVILEGTYTYTRTLDKSSGRPLPGRAKHAGTFGTTFRAKKRGTRWRIRGRWSGLRPFFEDQTGDSMSERVNAARFVSLDTRLSQTFFENSLTVFFGVKNLLDAGEVNYLPVQPRTLYGGITARY